MKGHHIGRWFWLAACLLLCSGAGTAPAAEPQRPSHEAERAEQARRSNSAVNSLTLQIDPSVRKDEALFKRCASWVLSVEDVRGFFAKAERISVEEKHHAYDSLPCSYQGVMTHRGHVFEFRINAGSHGYLKEIGTSADDAEVHFGCIEKCAALFPFDLY